MMFLRKQCVALVVSLYTLLSAVNCDMLDPERSNFFGLTHEVPLSASTLELAEHLQQAVQEHARGDRRVRRYYDDYDMPFVGVARRNRKDV